MTTYATGNDLIARYDADLIGDLANDDRVTIDRSSGSHDIAFHPNVVEALDDASGEINAALMVGGRYSIEQLAELSDQSKKHLVRITCAIAMCGLFDRRPEAASEKYRERVYDRAKELLKSLKSGDNIFGLPEEIEAGLIDVGGPDVIDNENRNDLTSRMERYFPHAGSRLPRHR